MEKLTILRWREEGTKPDTEALLAAGDRIARAGDWVTVNVEHTGEAAVFRFATDPDGLVLSSCVSVWVDRWEQGAAIIDQLPPAARTATYLVAESVPRRWSARDWVDGVRSPGVSLLTTFPMIHGIDDETFFANWHGSHSELTVRIHPVQRYVRNSVLRPIGPAPASDAVVIESFAVSDLLDPTRFYGAGEPEIPWKQGMAMMNDDLATFCDMGRLQTAPTDEHILSSAPWER